MKQLLQVSAIFDHPALVQNLVEKLAVKPDESYFNEEEEVLLDFNYMYSSCAETYVNGTLVINFNSAEQNINMPFTTRFLFTCIKERNNRYKLIWSHSIS